MYLEACESPGRFGGPASWLRGPFGFRNLGAGSRIQVLGFGAGDRVQEFEALSWALGFRGSHS